MFQWRWECCKDLVGQSTGFPGDVDRWERVRLGRRIVDVVLAGRVMCEGKDIGFDAAAGVAVEAGGEVVVGAAAVDARCSRVEDAGYVGAVEDPAASGGGDAAI